MRLLRFIRSLVPVSRRRYELELRNVVEAAADSRNALELLHKHRIDEIHANYRRELSQATAAVDALVKRAASIVFVRGTNDVYRCVIDFDSRAFGGGSKLEMKLVAGSVSNSVFQEIASCRFIDSAHNWQRRLQQSVERDLRKD